jgi:hypothetical protein
VNCGQDTIVHNLVARESHDTHSGKVEGETMSGDIEVAGVTGNFSGKRS